MTDGAKPAFPAMSIEQAHALLGQPGSMFEVAEAEVRGVRVTFQGYRAAPTFGVLPHVAPNGRTYLWLTHGHGNADSPSGSDSRECHDGHITVTPLNADLTAHDLIAPLAQALG